MKKALNLTTLITGIVAVVMAALGIISSIIFMILTRSATGVIINMILVLVQLALSIGLIMSAKKEKALLGLICACIALVLIILDLFVIGASISIPALVFATLAKSAAIAVIFNVIGYILLAGFVAVIALQVFNMIKSKK